MHIIKLMTMHAMSSGTACLLPFTLSNIRAQTRACSHNMVHEESSGAEAGASAADMCGEANVDSADNINTWLERLDSFKAYMQMVREGLIRDG